MQLYVYENWAIVRRYLRDSTFSRSVEHRLVTDRHTTTTYTALAWRRAVKIAGVTSVYVRVASPRV